MTHFFSFLTGITLLLTLSNFGYSQTTDEYEKEFKERAKYLVDQIADNYTPPNKNIGDPEKYYWPKVIARFEKYGIEDQFSNSILEEFRRNAPFHFTLVGMARIFSRYQKSPALNKYAEDYLQAVWDRDDSYNSWSAEGTENHINMTRTSAYIFAAESRKYNQFQDAAKRVKEMEEWLTHFGTNVYKVGTGEWNSSTYAVYHIIGWLNVYDYAPDPEVKAIARAVLDYYAMEMALHYTNGVIGGAELRGAVNYKFEDGSSYLGWLWFGDGCVEPTHPDFFVGQQYIQSIHAVTSTYRPPLEVVKLAKKNNNKPAYYTFSQGDYLQANPGTIHRHLFVEGGFSLGSTTNNYGGYSGASSQILTWKLVARKEKQNEGVYTLTGNGMTVSKRDGSSKDPYTQNAQYQNVLFQVTCTPKDHIEYVKKVDNMLTEWNVNWYKDFKVRFPTDFFKKNIVTKIKMDESPTNKSFVLIPKTTTQTLKEDKTLFLNLNDNYVAIHFLGKGKATQSPEETSQFLTFVDENDLDQVCGFIVETGTKQQEGGFQQFVTKVKANKAPVVKDLKVSYTSIRGVKMDFTYQKEGTFTEPIVDWGYGTQEQHIIIKSPPYLQPKWPVGVGYGKLPLFSVNGSSVSYTKHEKHLQGTNVNLDKGVLNINGYTIEYKKGVPKFSK